MAFIYISSPSSDISHTQVPSLRLPPVHHCSPANFWPWLSTRERIRSWRYHCHKHINNARHPMGTHDKDEWLSFGHSLFLFQLISSRRLFSRWILYYLMAGIRISANENRKNNYNRTYKCSIIIDINNQCSVSQEPLESGNYLKEI